MTSIFAAVEWIDCDPPHSARAIGRPRLPPEAAMLSLDKIGGTPKPMHTSHWMKSGLLTAAHASHWSKSPVAIR